MCRRTLLKYWAAILGDPPANTIAPELFAQLADHASNAVLIADIGERDQPISYVNAAFERLTGYDRADVLGKNCRYLQGADRLQPGVGEIRQAIAAGAGCEVRLRNYRKDGTLFWNQLRLSPLGPDGAPTHYAGFIRDVTDLVQAEARVDALRSQTELRSLVEMKEQLVLNVSHELRTPVTSIAGSLSLLHKASAAHCRTKLFHSSILPAEMLIGLSG